MRIAQVNDVASVASELTAALRERGHEVDLLQPWLRGGGLDDRWKPLAAPVRAAEIAALAARLRRGRYDIAHIHYAYLGVTGRLARFPYILHAHGDDVRAIGPLRRAITRPALRAAAHVFYATPELGRALAGERPDAEFLPNPVDTAAFSPAPEPADGEDVWIACWLEENKGVAHLLEACRVLLARSPEARVTAVARGPHVEAFAALPNVVLVAPQPRWKLPALIARHKVVVGQVHDGAVGMAEIEAMACGRPLVARFRYADAYPEPPPIVDVADGAEIADAVAELLATPAARVDLGQRTRAWTVRYHAREVAAACVEAVFEAVLAGVDPSRGSA